MTWSAEQYALFEDERTRPVRDLLAGIPAGDARAVIDIGCGPGNSTELLRARFPEAAARGLDSSAAMLAAARLRLPGVGFDQVDIAAWDEPGPFDVILANAVLHWLPDHAALFPRLVAKLRPGGTLDGKVRPGGTLAVQMPDNLDDPVQALMRQVADEGPWAAKLAAAAGARARVGTAQWYYGLLRPLCSRVDVWRTTYHHPLADAGAVVEWFKGSGLRPFLAPLDEAERAAYLARYRDAVAGALPAQPGGEVLLPFPRLFIVATR